MYRLPYTSLLVLLLSSLLSFPLSAQTEWFKSGEVFYYEVTTGFDAQNYGIHSMTYSKDTVINNHLLKILRYTDKRGVSSYLYVQQNGEKVRHYTPFLNQFTLMYDFTALTGDPAPVTGYTIEATGSIELENTIRKTQTWKKGNQRVLIIEGIGMVGDPNFMALYVCSPPVPSFGCTGYVDGWDYYFRCMKSDTATFDPYGRCASSHIQEEYLYTTLYPNPTHHTFTLKSNRVFDEYRIFDHTGRMASQVSFSPKDEVECRIDINPSLYYLQIYSRGKLITTKKLVVLPAP